MRARTRSLLRWYPEPWRDRYGDELVALMDDDLFGRKPTLRFRASIAWAGLRERSHHVGLTGDSAPAEDRSRTGSLLVLCAWTAFVVAGSSFSKVSEQFQQAVPGRARTLSSGAYDTILALAIIGGLLVLTGAAVALPAFLRFLRSGGWSKVRHHLRRALVGSVLTLAALISLKAFAHDLTAPQRNGGDSWYSLAFSAGACVLVATLCLWTTAAVAAVRRLVLPAAVLRVEAMLALFVALAILVMTAAAALWWGVVASRAPWFLGGVRPGSPASPFDPNLVATMSLMLVAIAVAGYGALRITRSWKELRLEAA